MTDFLFSNMSVHGPEHFLNGQHMCTKCRRYRVNHQHYILLHNSLGIISKQKAPKRCYVWCLSKYMCVYANELKWHWILKVLQAFPINVYLSIKIEKWKFSAFILSHHFSSREYVTMWGHKYKYCKCRVPVKRLENQLVGQEGTGTGCPQEGNKVWRDSKIFYCLGNNFK